MLGEEHLRALLEQIGSAGEFESFRVSAAGSGSPVFQRLESELAARTGLQHDPQRGQLLLRVRPAGSGWEVLARLTPRPLSARAWRVRDVPGALNATIAAALLRLLGMGPRDRFANLMCGSGTLLAERLLAGRAQVAVGVDDDPVALAAAAANLDAAGVAASLIRGDVRRAPLKEGAFGALCADLPYGARSGSHGANDALYRDFLATAAAIAAPRARLAVITHDIRRFEQALAASGAWRTERTLRVFQKGYRPQVWLLDRPQP
jgi:23S rRNA G2445 N2-methylase RlmL